MYSDSAAELLHSLFIEIHLKNKVFIFYISCLNSL